MNDTFCSNGRSSPNTVASYCGEMRTHSSLHFTPPARTNRGLTVKHKNSNCIFDFVRATLTVLPSFESTSFWQIKK